MIRTAERVGSDPFDFVLQHPEVVPVNDGSFDSRNVIMGADADILLYYVAIQPQQENRNRLFPDEAPYLFEGLYQPARGYMGSELPTQDGQALRVVVYPGAQAINQLSEELGGSLGNDVPRAVYAPAEVDMIPAKEYVEYFSRMQYPLSSGGSGLDGFDYFVHDRSPSAHIPALWVAPRTFWTGITKYLQQSKMSSNEAAHVLDISTQEITIAWNLKQYAQSKPRETRHTTRTASHPDFHTARLLGTPVQGIIRKRVLDTDYRKVLQELLDEREAELIPLVQAARERRGLAPLALGKSPKST